MRSCSRAARAPAGFQGTLLILCCAVTLMAPTRGIAQSVAQNLWVTDQEAFVVVRSGQTIYLGGGFSSLGPPSGGGVPFDLTAGTPAAGFPQVAGSVSAAVSDGAGGWYIGRSFSSVGGVQRFNLAQVNADMTVSAWNPNGNFTFHDNSLGFTGVMALAVSGSTVYVGGDFTAIGTQSRKGIAAVDAVSGAVTGWDPSTNNGWVHGIAVIGSTVYLGGHFGTLGGQPRLYLGAVDAGTGAATAWNPGADSDVYALVTDGANLYVGGYFTQVGGQPRSRLAALDATTGLATGWDPSAQGEPGNTFVGALALNGATVYAGGRYTTIGGQARRDLAALDATTGSATAWNPNAVECCGGGIEAIAVAGSSVYVGGYMSSIGGTPCQYGGAVDATTGVATAWIMKTNGDIRTLAVSGSAIYVGGSFSSVATVTRNNIAALDATTGMATSWNPNIDGGVDAIVVVGSTLYVGGNFSHAGGQPHAGIVAIDAATGAVSAWDPHCDYWVRTIVADGPTLYVGGQFTTIGGQPRNNLAAIDVTSGLASSWNPNANGAVNSLTKSGSTLFAGGEFTQVGGQPRSYLAAMDASSGAVTAWDPSADRVVYTVLAQGCTVFAGGSFNNLGSTTRYCIAAIDATTGVPTTWATNAYYPQVKSLALAGSTLYVGGEFLHHIGAVDAVTGVPSPWNPDVSGVVQGLDVYGNIVYAVGSISFVNGSIAGGIAAIDRGTVNDVPFSGCSTGTVAGIVSADCPTAGTPLVGVTVDAFSVGTGDLAATSATNATGGYTMPNLPAGSYTVSVVIPLGFTAAAPQVPVTVSGGTSTANFALHCVTIAANSRSIGFWMHQIGVATGGNGKADVSAATLCSYLDLIAVHFNSNEINPVIVYQPPASGACSDKLQAARVLLDLQGNAAMIARARQQLLSLLLNVAAGYIGQTAVISLDGATVSQAITYCDNQIDSPTGDYEKAKTIADDINNGIKVPAGMIPLNTAQIAYRRGMEGVSFRVTPGAGGATRDFQFMTGARGPVSLRIFDVSGRLVAQLYQGTMEAGPHSVSWNGRASSGAAIARGLYFARLQTPRESPTIKVLELAAAN